MTFRKFMITALVVILILITLVDQHTLEAEEIPVVNTYSALVTAIADAPEGGTIGLDSTIYVPVDAVIGDPAKRITIKRMGAMGRLASEYADTELDKPLKIQNIVFDGAEIDGDVPFVQLTCQSKITDCDFKGCKTPGLGSALNMQYGYYFSLMGCNFTGNKSNLSGGAVYISSVVDNCTFQGCTFSGNESGQNGGAIYSGYMTGEINLNNSKISGNNAQIGGGLYSCGVVNVANSLIYSNTATQGADIASEGTLNMDEDVAHYKDELEAKGLYATGWKKETVEIDGNNATLYQLETTTEDPNAKQEDPPKEDTTKEDPPAEEKPKEETPKEEPKQESTASNTTTTTTSSSDNHMSTVTDSHNTADSSTHSDTHTETHTESTSDSHNDSRRSTDNHSKSDSHNKTDNRKYYKTTTASPQTASQPVSISAPISLTVPDTKGVREAQTVKEGQSVINVYVQIPEAKQTDNTKDLPTVTPTDSGKDKEPSSLEGIIIVMLIFLVGKEVLSTVREFRHKAEN